jgi:hypothetical protein
MSARIIQELIGRRCPQRADLELQPAFQNFDAWPGALGTASPYQRMWIECDFDEHSASQFEKEILQARPLSPPVS